MDNFDLKKYLAEGKLHKPTLNEFIGGELEKRNEALYDKLVPGMGAADTVEGEMLRAMNRIIYRYYNDGDYYYKGYGIETAGPAHSFLVNAYHPQKSALRRIFDESRGEEYEQMLNDALDVILDHIESRQGDYTKNSEDMFDYEPEFEQEEEDDDWDDYGYDDEDEDEDIYENELKESKGVKLTQEEYTDLYPVIGRGGLGYQFNYSPKLGGAYISPRDGEDALSIAQEIEGKFEGKLEAEPFQYQDQQFVSGTRAGSIPTGTESTFLRIVKAN